MPLLLKFGAKIGKIPLICIRSVDSVFFYAYEHREKLPHLVRYTSKLVDPVRVIHCLLLTLVGMSITSKIVWHHLP